MAALYAQRHGKMAASLLRRAGATADIRGVKCLSKLASEADYSTHDCMIRKKRNSMRNKNPA